MVFIFSLNLLFRSVTDFLLQNSFNSSVYTGIACSLVVIVIIQLFLQVPITKDWLSDESDDSQFDSHESTDSTSNMFKSEANTIFPIYYWQNTWAVAYLSTIVATPTENIIYARQLNLSNYWVFFITMIATSAVMILYMYTEDFITTYSADDYI